jgi:hypothetical protein
MVDARHVSERYTRYGKKQSQTLDHTNRDNDRGRDFFAPMRFAPTSGSLRVSKPSICRARQVRMLVFLRCSAGAAISAIVQSAVSRRAFQCVDHHAGEFKVASARRVRHPSRSVDNAARLSRRGSLGDGSGKRSREAYA